MFGLRTRRAFAVAAAVAETAGAGAATGVTFHPVDALAFGKALTQLLDLYHQPKLWAKLRANAMGHPVGWETSAKAYAGLYDSLTA